MKLRGKQDGRRMAAVGGLCALALCAARTAGGAAAAPAAPPVPLAFTTNLLGGATAPSLSVPLRFPGEAPVRIFAPSSNWVAFGALEVALAWPAGAPTNAQVLFFFQDWDYNWYQNLRPGALIPGATNVVRVDLLPGSRQWVPHEHHATWHLRTLMEPKVCGLRVFTDAAWTGACRVVAGAALPRADEGAPVIEDVRASARTVPCYETFELTFRLPDRYPDPFDAAAVQVSARVTLPDGKDVTVDGFYAQDYYRELRPTGERIVPQGAPVWRVRFAPWLAGSHVYRLHVRDRWGEAHWGPAAFVAGPARQPGFVRVSARDPRCFEFSGGAPYFPLGHNIRSPFDARLDKLYPWKQRWPEGSSVYERYLRAMQQRGENFGEVWLAGWSLGLEWVSRQPGSHGVGQYNLRHAWELDRVLDWADACGVYLSLVLHHHGKFSLYWDSEWDDNPFSVKNGGYLQKPEEFFTDPRAQADFLKLMRYLVARWGSSSRVFAWQLWSELDLVGSEQGFGMTFYRTPVATAWHKQMGAAIKALDPYDHLIASHVCNDYSRQSPAIMALPEMDYCGVDAYYHDSSPLRVLGLMRETAAYNNPYRKPVLITEFGGSPEGASIRKLDEDLHVGLWGSCGVPLGGTPMFWWWELIEEAGFQGKFAAFSRFMAGEDRRGTNAVPADVAVLLKDQAAPNLGAVCLRSPTAATGWIYNGNGFGWIDPAGEPRNKDLVLQVGGLDDRPFRVEFWNTVSGDITARAEATAKEHTLSVPLPPFARDIAFKIRSK